MPRGNKIRPINKKLLGSTGNFCYMFCLISIIVGVCIILSLCVIFNIMFCIKNVRVEKARAEIATPEFNESHVHSHSGSPIKWEEEEKKFIKLHNYGYWEKRQKTTREKISSILPLFKEQSLHREHTYNSSIFSPSLFNNDELKTPNSPDTMSTQNYPI